MLLGHYRVSYYLLLCYLSFIFFYLKICETRPQPDHLINGFLRSTNSKDENVSGNKTKTRILNRGDFVHEYAEQDIIFPDSTRVVFEPLPKIDGPPKCAKGQTYCEDDTLYPYTQIQGVLRRNQIQSDLFGKDEPPDDLSIINRIGEETDENFLCSSEIRTIFPKIAQNKNDEWKFIINQNEAEGYIQGVRIETCRRQDAPCDTIVEVPVGYITSCKQKYMLRRMMSLSNSGEPIADTFRMPSACCCAYRKNLGFLSRIGRPTSPVK